MTDTLLLGKLIKQSNRIVELEASLRAALAQQAEQKPVSTINFLPHDDHLRFVQRVLEGDAPQSDRDDAAQMVRDIRRSLYIAASPQVAQQAEQGWVRVPAEPTEEMWGYLARDIVFWLYAAPAPHYGSKLHSFLRKLGTEIPDWLTQAIPDIDHTPAKGTVAGVIYKAMLAAAPKGGI